MHLLWLYFLVSSDAGEWQRKFGARVRELRMSRGWSQERLAFESGLNRTYLGAVERGERNISLVNISKIARSLRIEMKELFDA